MLLTKLLKIKSHNVKYYTEKGYLKHKRFDVIEINPNDLPHGSHYKVEVECDVCKSTKILCWNKYLKNIKKYNLYCCSNKCAVIKNKLTNVERYGTEYTLQSDEVKLKSEITCLKKYNSKKYMGSEDFIEKAKITKERKYGNSFYNNINKILTTKLDRYGDSFYNNRDKYKETCISRYKAVHHMMNNEIKENVKTNNLKKYGVITNLLHQDTIDKIKETNIVKYGHEISILSNEIRDKIKKTILERYGNEVYTKSTHYKNGMYNKINDRLKLFGCELISRDCHKNIVIKHKKCGNIFTIHSKTLSQRMDYIENSKNNIISICLKCSPLYNISFMETELFSFISNFYKGKIIRNYRDGIEIDIYLPDLNLGFEYNGIYWHSELHKDKNYHLDKLNYFNDRGIEIIYIWEDDWNHKKDIIKSMVLNRLFLTKRKIYARKCEVREVNDNVLIRKFLNTNHIQGFTKSLVKIGLYYENKIISLMTFGYRHTNSKKEYELIRFCTKLNTIVVGGASKLFKYFLNNNKYNNKYNEIISYCDISHSNGNIYEILKFQKISQSVPNYYWVVDGIKRHRFNYTKHKLVKEGYDKNLTEKQIMHSLGYYRVFGCGQTKYIFKNPTISNKK